MTSDEWFSKIINQRDQPLFKCNVCNMLVRSTSIGSFMYGRLGCACHGRGTSKIASECFIELEIAMGYPLQFIRLFEDGHAEGDEKTFDIGRPRPAKFDCYDAMFNTVIEFQGRKWHGFPPGKYPNGYLPDDIVHGITLHQRYLNTMQKQIDLKTFHPHLNVAHIWEHEYMRYKQLKKKRKREGGFVPNILSLLNFTE